MQPDSEIILRQIRDAIIHIESHTGGFSAEMFDNVLVTQHAVLWNLAIIGEAMTRLRKSDPTIAERISEWDRIIKMRNQLIHGYDTIRNQIVWNVVETKLPILQREVHEALGLPPPPSRPKPWGNAD